MGPKPKRVYSRNHEGELACQAEDSHTEDIYPKKVAILGIEDKFWGYCRCPGLGGPGLGDLSYGQDSRPVKELGFRRLSAGRINVSGLTEDLA